MSSFARDAVKSSPPPASPRNRAESRGFWQTSGVFLRRRHRERTAIGSQRINKVKHTQNLP